MLSQFPFAVLIGTHLHLSHFDVFEAIYMMESVREIQTDTNFPIIDQPVPVEIEIFL